MARSAKSESTKQVEEARSFLTERYGIDLSQTAGHELVARVQGYRNRHEKLSATKKIDQETRLGRKALRALEDLLHWADRMGSWESREWKKARAVILSSRTLEQTLGREKDVHELTRPAGRPGLACKTGTTHQFRTQMSNKIRLRAPDDQAVVQTGQGLVRVTFRREAIDIEMVDTLGSIKDKASVRIDAMVAAQYNGSDPTDRPGSNHDYSDLFELEVEPHGPVPDISTVSLQEGEAEISIGGIAVVRVEDCDEGTEVICWAISYTGEIDQDSIFAELRLSPVAPTFGVNKLMGEPIEAEAHSDDRCIEVRFDAREWFAQASDEEIANLAEIDWGGDYATDEIAYFMAEKDEDVARLFTYLSFDPRFYGKTVGFECTIDADSALAWLKQFRPSALCAMYATKEMDAELDEVVDHIPPQASTGVREALIHFAQALPGMEITLEDARPDLQRAARTGRCEPWLDEMLGTARKTGNKDDIVRWTCAVLFVISSRGDVSGLAETLERLK